MKQLMMMALKKQVKYCDNLRAAEIWKSVANLSI